MLKKLTIKDYALIDELHVDFGAGLNILTGETGTGKSIIIGALSLLLGERANTDVIRQGADMAVVEGLFEVPVSEKWQESDAMMDASADGLLLRREVHLSGRSRAFANDSPIAISQLSAIGDHLVDLHGQHAHQTLLHVQRHLDYLDNYGVDAQLRNRLKESFKQFKSLTTELNTLREAEAQLRKKQELLEFQVQEIDKADPREGEEEALELEDKTLQNAERLFEASNQLNDLLYEGEGSASEKLKFAENILTGLRNVDPSFEKWTKESESARIAAEEVARGFQAYVSKIEFNPQRLEEVRERLGMFTHLKKKYGGSMEQVLKFRESARKELNQIETMGEEIDKISMQLEEENRKLSHVCQEVSAIRVKTASELASRAVVVLEELGLKNGVFNVDVQQKESAEGPIQVDSQSYDVSSRGIDKAEFLISLNPGEAPKPLAKVASGGEISRIMLALKTVLAEADEIPVLVFDEIDTGISGRVARVVGNNLKEVSTKRQVICITHLPQIASMSDIHFCVEKEVKNNRSRTTIRRLKAKEQIMEIAKLIGGEKVTESAVQSARELLNM
jgi:DNA repair protein RecN (Recombination protein N)